MFDVLIAEDEMLVRIGLKNSIDWEKLNMRVIADVANGQDAMEVYEREKPDLIITDIKMPVMDGMELISKIREKDTKTKIVILTCYEEFDTVHKAINLGVSGYILKLKMTPSEMEAVLKKVQEELSLEDGKKAGLEEKNPSIGSISKENLFKNFIFYKIYSDAEIEDAVRKMQLRLSQRHLLICRMVIDNYSFLQDKFDDEHGELIRFSILNMMDELLTAYKRGEVLHEKDGNYLVIFSFSDIFSEKKVSDILSEILSRIKTVMKTYINADITFFISNMYDSYGSLPQMYHECLQAAENNYFSGIGEIVRYEDTISINPIPEAIARLEGLKQDLRNFNQVWSREIDGEINRIRQLKALTKADMQRVFIKWIYRPTMDYSPNKSDIYKLAQEYSGKIQQLATMGESIQCLKDYLNKVENNKARYKNLSSEILKVIQFIEMNYTQDISLQQAADHVSMSPNYLSNLFKKELNVSFVEYINRFRIEKAKELLLNTNLKIYEIAVSVGIRDEGYFSRLFKKITSMRPYEYRKY